MKSLRAFLVVLAASFVAQCAAAANLVDAAWLAKNLQSADVVVLDASPMHAKGHIPGAVPVNAMSVASFGVRDGSTQVLEKIFQSAGVSADKKIVIYDEGGSWFAPRVFFAMQYHGFPVSNLYLLDGGFAKWQADGLPVTRDATPAPKAGTFKVKSPDEQMRSRIPELVAASGDRSKVLLDALGPEYHYGAAAFFNKAGHIPHAVSLPADDFFNADKTFKSPAEIRKMAALYGVRPEQEVHSHCGGGGAAAVPYFALKHLAGFSKVKLAVESQMGWLQDDRDLPFWTYASPSMVREVEWLGTWGSPMMRMYGVSNVSVVDVRAPASYAQGHVPFALNVPAETFRGAAGAPARLAEALSAAGVNPAHEAVVVSGAGVTKDAALAYAMLEKLGQAKVSIFTESLESVDSLDKMARMNFAVTKEATVVGKPTKPGQMVVPPAAYPATNVRGGVTIADPKAGSGAYPKVFIASGAAVPARAVDGKVVHVPYTELLKPDGTPRPAKDIWAVLKKAGVSPYAELVAYSDDPGEAAVNYFVLRLMGYPDVKVLL
jgi:thiosulfate/3-mercaptopyruvate sulfurtransferase